MEEKIVQFGTGNFLRGFFDRFIDTLQKKGLFDGAVAVVSPTSSARIDLLNAQHGTYNLYLRGLEDGRPVDRRTEIHAISRGVDPYRDFDAFLLLARVPALRFAVSNTTEAGIAFVETDRLSDRPASSFPGKLTQFLYARYKAGLPGLAFFACELIDDNAGALRRCLLRYCALWQLEAGFRDWLTRENTFHNTLVDCIVPGFPADAETLWREIGWRDRLLDVAEPYHLWVIEGDFEAELPLQKAGLNVVWTDDCTPYKTRKVRILNGLHTSLVFPALLCGVETVRESLADADLRAFLDACLSRCILPSLGNTEADRRFAQAVLERFQNPYLAHRWASIALNSVSKFRARVLPTLLACESRTGKAPRPLVFALACLLHFYQTQDAPDAPEVCAALRARTLPEILADKALWGDSLSRLEPELAAGLRQLRTNGIREAIRWSIC